MMPLGFASLLAGAVLLIAGITGSSIPSVATGDPDRSKATGPATPVEASAAASNTGDAPAPSVAGAAASGGTAAEKALVQKISTSKGWNAADWEAVIEKESGWDSTATNPASGAFGIGQFLGATKAEYAKYGSESTNPLEQLVAMSVYIQTRYGTPTKALEHEEANHWY